MMTENTLNEAKAWFESYSQGFKSVDNTIQKSIDMKRSHTIRVAENTAKLAQVLQFGPEQKVVAGIIAWGHDAGRFLQVVQYGTFNDAQSTDHAVLSAQLIEEAPFFATIDPSWQAIIKTAILHHSKIQLPKIENEQALPFCQLIRDADKLDVWAMATIHYNNSRNNDELSIIMLNLPNQLTASEKVIKSLLQGKLVVKEDMKSMNDFRLMLMSWVFDLHFKASYQMLAQQRYMEKLYDALPKQDGIINAYRAIKLFIENKFVEK